MKLASPSQSTLLTQVLQDLWASWHLKERVPDARVYSQQGGLADSTIYRTNDVCHVKNMKCSTNMIDGLKSRNESNNCILSCWVHISCFKPWNGSLIGVFNAAWMQYAWSLRSPDILLSWRDHVVTISWGRYVHYRLSNPWTTSLGQLLIFCGSYRSDHIWCQ